MRLAYLSGAYKNAGDFLIEKRGIEILRFVYPNADIVKILRNKIADNWDLLNDCDAIIIAGGPIFMKSMDRYMPISEYLYRIKKPTMILGGGWWGQSGKSSDVYRYTFDEATKKFLDKVHRDGFGFGCRDLHTVKTLIKSGYPNVEMTGCPAWYDLENINTIALRSKRDSFQKIIISDPGKTINFQQGYMTAEYVKKRFPKSHITFAFHRGINPDQYTSDEVSHKTRVFAESIRRLGIGVTDISGSADGFDIYDDCDLHVGFRVHAHIYSLSKRNRSILIEEDGRGAGVNEVLGLPGIRGYNDYWVPTNSYVKKIYRKIFPWRNRELIKELDVIMNTMLDTKGQYYLNAFALQERYFDNMLRFVRQLS